MLWFSYSRKYGLKPVIEKLFVQKKKRKDYTFLYS